MRFMQLLCEGHNAPFQTFLCAQDGAPVGCPKYNVLEEAVRVLDKLSSNVIKMLGTNPEFFCSFSTSCLEFVCEAVLGPCWSNQKYLSSSELPHILEALYKKLSYANLLQVEEFEEDYLRDCLDEVSEVKAAMCNLVIGLLEGADKNLIQTVAEGLSSAELVKNIREILSPSSGLCFQMLNNQLNEMPFLDYAASGAKDLMNDFKKKKKKSKVKTSPLVEFMSEDGEKSRQCKMLHDEALACFVILRYLEPAIGDGDFVELDALCIDESTVGKFNWHPDITRKLLARFCHSCEIMREEAGRQVVRRVHFTSCREVIEIKENKVMSKVYTERFESASRDNASAKVRCTIPLSPSYEFECVR